MTNQTRGTPTMYALLIGIDCYLPNRLPDGSWYPSLGGCVRDISHVEAFLKRTFHTPQDNILKLTATDTGAQEPVEPREQWPTYENMVSAFKQLKDRAQPGDQVTIHYSGHGGRAPTLLPKLKGEGGLDEGLVPTDIGDAEARYLRDIELTMLLNDMVAKGLTVAVVLDSCHSGGMTRGGGDVAVRGISSVDTTPRPTHSLAGSQSELAQLWGHLTQGGKRDVSLGSGWLPEPQGYVLLAACRPSEAAFEYAFKGSERNGALTYWLLDSLHDIGPGLSYKVLHDRILAKVHSQFERQTPQLQGEGDRVIFGAERAQPCYGVPVMQVDRAQERILLGAGQAHGLRQGAQFAIYPRGTTDFTKLDKRQAIVEISELGATDAWAGVIQRFGKKAVEGGAQAVLLGAGSVRLVRQVGLVRQAHLDPALDQGAALGAVERALEGNGWLQVAGDGAEITFQVAVNEGGEYEIWDGTGQEIGNLHPALKIRDPKSASDVARRLEHLAKYRAVEQLNNHDPMSPLARKLVVELVGKRAEYDPGDPFEPESFDDAGHTPTLRVGEWTGLRIKNEAAQSLNVCVLDLEPGWGVRQIYPGGVGDHFVEFEPGQELVLPLRAGLPAGYQQGTDTLKVFATVGTTNFRWLELPALDQPITRSPVVSGRKPGNPLEEMLAAFTAGRPPKRDLIPAAYPSHEWITEQVQVRIQQQEQEGTA
jgi:hypothetical protein